MYKWGIIALSSERPPMQKKWWQFWKKRDDYEIIELKEFGEAIIVYVPKKFTADHIDQALDFFEEQGITEIVYSKLMNNELQATSMEKGSILRALSVRIIQNRAKNLGLDSRELRIAYKGKNLDATLLIKLAKNCKYLTLITENTSNAQRVTERIFDETGLPVEVLESRFHTNSSNNADYKAADCKSYDFIITDDGIENLNLQLTNKSVKQIILPVDVEEEELTVILWKIGAIKTENIEFEVIRKNTA